MTCGLYKLPPAKIFMTAATDTIEKLSHEENEYPPPKIVVENALLKDAKVEYERWIGFAIRA